ncbi:MAG: class I SAM-dependent DNA methyltransferase [Treponemataceae bacterium]
MDKEKVKEFFNNRADNWDEGRKSNTEVIEKILDYADIKSGCSVLDVACGTGVLFPYCIERNVSSITAVDISEKMCEHAAKKFTDERIKVICADIIDSKIDIPKADRCIVFNAFPHLGEVRESLRALCSYLCPEGILTIAHAGNSESINKHHMEKASLVSESLPLAKDLAKIFEEYAHILHIIETENLYVVSGRIKSTT